MSVRTVTVPLIVVLSLLIWGARTCVLVKYCTDSEVNSTFVRCVVKESKKQLY